MELREGDIIYDEYLIRDNGDGTHTLYRDGWEAPYTTEKADNHA